ncbi:MAG: hypothetical protein GYB68_13710 [Chloroflexi bacterium]|nr:hypothetical protein [Chloroflexota bacterium]
MSDDVAAATFTQAVFSSGQMVFPEPALIQREGDIVVVGLPDGLGIFLYDLRQPRGTPPLEISRWTMGLRVLEVRWVLNSDRDPVEIGVIYGTQGQDGTRIPHYALATYNANVSTWRVNWLSDEDPDWWFNSQNGRMAVASDLSLLAVEGEAENTTAVFIETDESPTRRFRVFWVREESVYIISPPVGSHPSRQAWLWQIAQPSPYATLVEFIERLRNTDQGRAANLTTSDQVVLDALDFGLYQRDREFRVVQTEQGDETIIVFQDQRGAFVARFNAPTTDEAPWLISDIRPIGADELEEDS